MGFQQEVVDSVMVIFLQTIPEVKEKHGEERGWAVRKGCNGVQRKPFTYPSNYGPNRKGEPHRLDLYIIGIDDVFRENPLQDLHQRMLLMKTGETVALVSVELDASLCQDRVTGRQRTTAD